MSAWGRGTKCNPLSKKDQSASQWCPMIDSVNEFESEKAVLRARTVIEFNLDEK